MASTKHWTTSDIVTTGYTQGATLSGSIYSVTTTQKFMVPPNPEPYLICQHNGRVASDRMKANCDCLANA